MILLEDFTSCWDRHEHVSVEEFLTGRAPLSSAQMVELIFQEYTLCREADLDPSPEDYLARFPDHVEALRGLFEVDAIAQLPPLRICNGIDQLPKAGDTVGPLQLLRELGEGAFSRVFLAEEQDLEDRLVVVKIATRVTPEHRLLARACHPNIMEVLQHGMVEGTGLQLICMPFHGGTTLTHVLAERRRRKSRPSTGADLLADLDRVAAPEYLERGTSRPSRELIERLSYSRTAAWIVARLAEALDFAYRRGVLHGDVKPANVLLTAEATPMLLDFNLSLDWKPAETGTRDRGLPDDGGTLAYMAPERLAVFLAQQERQAAELARGEARREHHALDHDPSIDDAKRQQVERRLADAEARFEAASQNLKALRLSVAGRHQADIYSLGVVLLELLTGRPPELQHANPERSLQEITSAYFTSRVEGGNVLLQAARRPVPAGLRSILARVLAPDPSDRYRHAAELAEDLDRWRTDRALLHAREPITRIGLLRWMRKQRLALAAGLVGLVAALAGAAVAWRTSEALNHGRSVLFYQIAGTWDSGAFSFRRQKSRQVKDPGDRALIARRHLTHFHVFGPGDWRQQPEFLDLPPFEREELEAWLLEQALRFAHALAERPDSPEDWQRALTLLERLASPNVCPPIDRLCAVLRGRLGRSEWVVPTSEPPLALASWIREYLAGVDAELSQGDSDAAAGREASDVDVVSHRPESRAIEHYRRVLETRPDAFWASYRAAAVAFKAEDYDASVGYMRRCVTRCPDNPILRIQLAGCLNARASKDLNRAPGLAFERAESLAEAAAQCDKAKSLDPDFPETYLSRSFLRIEMGQTEASRQDFLHFENLNGLGRPVHHADPGALALPGASTTEALLATTDGRAPRSLANDSDEASIRTYFARALIASGRTGPALEELDRAIELEPDRIRPRYLRGYLRDSVNDGRAVNDFTLVVAHPEYDDLVARSPDTLYALERVAWEAIGQKTIPEAVELGRRGVALAERHRHRRAELHFTLAVALAFAGEREPKLRGEAYRELQAAGQENPDFVTRQVKKDDIVASLLAEFGPLSPTRP